MFTNLLIAARPATVFKKSLPDENSARQSFESALERGQHYFKAVPIELNSVLRLVPKLFTAVMIASAIPAAIRPYSIAVAPDWSDRNFKKQRRKCASLVMLIPSGAAWIYNTL